MSKDEKDTAEPETYEERMVRTNNPFYRYYAEHPDEFAERERIRYAEGQKNLGSTKK